MAQKRKRCNQAQTNETEGPMVDSTDEPNDINSTAPSTQTHNATQAKSTDEERLEHARKLSRNQVSMAYASYKPPVLSSQLDKFGRRMIAWICKTCGKTVNRPTYNSSCSNLLTHAGRCLRKQHNPMASRGVSSVGVIGIEEIDPQEVLQRCALWCAETASPFSALEQVSHKKILHPTGVKNLPTRKMVSKAIHLLYVTVQEELCQELKNHTGAIYLGFDAWQAPNGFDMMRAVIYQLKEDNNGEMKLEATPLDFVQLKEHHTGQYLARMVQFIVQKFGLENRICGIVSDNASNNATMINELNNLNWPRFNGDASWIRCFAHILNLIVKAILRPFAKQSAGGATNSNCSDDEEQPHEMINSFDDTETNSDSDHENDLSYATDMLDGELQPGEELTLANICELNDEDVNDVFRAIATKLKKSPNSKQKFLEICQENECKNPHNIECDVPTRWNSTYTQISSIFRSLYGNAISNMEHLANLT
ncbi:hypothetical protein PTTG_27750 [Puccinia triticina 1-1 BBBD Race 1]|uniref:DUF659 domain-containing protein n=1 Tax=Puccinia triticina (isolate 1-1 / race 1 (BBBD)) TaxID=630390 RepID=A0A180GI18_PUCT1|nr:hypothetical protein PTTG_27750 [Puccinia triticina 1-1 BBBD Race 1]